MTKKLSRPRPHNDIYAFEYKPQKYIKRDEKEKKKKIHNRSFSLHTITCIFINKKEDKERKIYL